MSGRSGRRGTAKVLGSGGLRHIIRLCRYPPNTRAGVECTLGLWFSISGLGCVRLGLPVDKLPEFRGNAPVARRLDEKDGCPHRDLSERRLKTSRTGENFPNELWD
jgi:hypothetical protein